ncbi:transposase [Deinococcus aestuarii]|uniref:transposase n=1 Tax=Deinococcus aestuarii TaxID=2774531 RepID=UPI001C0C24A4
MPRQEGDGRWRRHERTPESAVWSPRSGQAGRDHRRGFVPKGPQCPCLQACVPRTRGRTSRCCAPSRPQVPLVVEGGVNGNVFVTDVRDVLVPVLRPGQVVVPNNLGAQVHPKVRESVEATGARLVYPPPYAPDLNPTEPMFFTLKAALRALAAGTWAGVDQVPHAAEAQEMDARPGGVSGTSRCLHLGAGCQKFL